MCIRDRVGNGHTAGFLGVVIKISLCIHIGVVADNLDGVFIGSNRTVSAQAPEFTAGNVFRSGGGVLVQFQRQVGYIVDNANSENFLLGIFVNGDNLCGSGVLRPCLLYTSRCV